MSHVAVVCSAPIVAEVRMRGLSTDALVEGLGLPLSAFEAPKGRIPWRAFVPFAARAEKMLGAEVIEDLAAEATVDSVPASLRRLLPRLTDSRTLFMLAPRWWGPRVFGGTQGVCEALPDGRLREIVKIRPELEASREFFSGLRGTLRAMPRLTGQPDALVEIEQDGREAEFLITPPPRRSRRSSRANRGRSSLLGGLAGGRSARRALEAAEREIEDIEFTRDELVATQRSLHLVTAELERLRRHERTIQALADLLATDSDDDLAAFQRNVVELLIQREEIVGARLARRGPEGDGDLEVSGGRRMGLADRIVALRIEDREVGQLSLWAALEGDDLASIEPIERWLALAIEYGSARALNNHLLQVLSDDVLDWQGMEQRLERLAERLSPTSR